MGTPGVMSFIIGARIRHSYVRWDAYPTGLGNGILQFILRLNQQQKVTMARNVSKLNWVNGETKPPQHLWNKYMEFADQSNWAKTYGVAPKFAGGEGRDRYPHDWYHLLYDLRGEMALPKILDGRLEHMVHDKEAAGCYFYSVDWDKEILDAQGQHLIKRWGFGDLTEKTMSEFDEADDLVGSKEEDEDWAQRKGYTVLR
ncbi:hypothetical protein K505DRAFT_371612 [Melanomma pulvis-pyrius CBS 109.77]|uniref:Uncharacterized protein n=1 Tax=Melanomma pulvis-pyrius CBS 109.77 TaxID=1314802 RepID=A0A6A6XQT9_9PLEO|nr:hypothetical protein K505DRAFT_371612 [Melanomma pulvis-pyrius CBS 109.77]